MNTTFGIRILIFIISIITCITLIVVYKQSDNIIEKERHGVVIAKDILHGGGKGSSSYPTLAIKLDSGQVYTPYMSYASYASFNIGDGIYINASDNDIGIYSSTTTKLGMLIIIAAGLIFISLILIVVTPI